MKSIIKVFKIFLITIVSIVIILFIYDVFIYEPYYPGPESEAPLPDLRTKREKQFCDSLTSLNYKDVNFYKRIYLDNQKGKVVYYYLLSYKKNPSWKKNQTDSINLECARLITTLLSKYTSNRTLYENEFFYINYADYSSAPRSFNKKTLEKICGFKVIKTGKYKYERIYTHKKDSEPKLFIPSHWIVDPDKLGPNPNLRTKREKQFCDSLRHHGYYDVRLDIQHYKLKNGNIEMIHRLTYKRDKPFSCEQEDSINYNNAELLSQLITYYVEDRAILYGKFIIECEDVNDNINQFMKWERKRICGFEVVKIGNNRFKRVYNRPKKSGIQLFIPEKWKGKKFLCLPQN